MYLGPVFRDVNHYFDNSCNTLPGNGQNTMLPTTHTRHSNIGPFLIYWTIDNTSTKFILINNFFFYYTQFSILRCVSLCVCCVRYILKQVHPVLCSKGLDNKCMYLAKLPRIMSCSNDTTRKYVEAWWYKNKKNMPQFFLAQP